MILAVCGKGGVGKTTVSAMLAGLLAENKSGKTLFLDADPTGGLSLALGIQTKRSLDTVQKEILAEVEKKKTDLRDIAVSIDYMVTEALEERGGLAFLSLGRPEDPGCYCRVNYLMRDAISVLAKKFDTVVIDAEAGIEQINRRVLNAVDYLLLVADGTAKSIRVAKDIQQVAQSCIGNVKAGLLLNRMRSEEEVLPHRNHEALPLLGWLPEDDTIRRFDQQELPFFDLPDCPAKNSFTSILETTGILR